MSGPRTLSLKLKPRARKKYKNGKGPDRSPPSPPLPPEHGRGSMVGERESYIYIYIYIYIYMLYYIILYHIMVGYRSWWVPSPLGKHTCQNCTNKICPRSAGKKKTRYPMGLSSRSSRRRRMRPGPRRADGAADRAADGAGERLAHLLPAEIASMFNLVKCLK